MENHFGGNPLLKKDKYKRKSVEENLEIIPGFLGQFIFGEFNFGDSRWRQLVYRKIDNRTSYKLQEARNRTKTLSWNHAVKRGRLQFTHR